MHQIIFTSVLPSFIRYILVSHTCTILLHIYKSIALVFSLFIFTFICILLLSMVVVVVILGCGRGWKLDRHGARNRILRSKSCLASNPILPRSQCLKF
ncbi:unnamed protein product [Amoebophrya sp. A25]|nr:unnamed protein product [Amoebophrya sp. A25]|eukprot:GSA25T00006773001.1